MLTAMETHYAYGEEQEPAFDIQAFLARMRPAWMQQAACRSRDEVERRENLELFFPTPSTAHSEIRRAYRVCAGCPVREECHSYAVHDPSLRGIWGGAGASRRKESRVAEMRARDSYGSY